MPATSTSTSTADGETPEPDSGGGDDARRVPTKRGECVVGDGAIRVE